MSILDKEIQSELVDHIVNIMDEQGLELSGNVVLLKGEYANHLSDANSKPKHGHLQFRDVLNLAIQRYYEEPSLPFLFAMTDSFVDLVKTAGKQVKTTSKSVTFNNNLMVPSIQFDIIITPVNIITGLAARQTIHFHEVWLQYQSGTDPKYINDVKGFDVSNGQAAYRELITAVNNHYFPDIEFTPYVLPYDPEEIIEEVSTGIIKFMDSRNEILRGGHAWSLNTKQATKGITEIAAGALYRMHMNPLDTNDNENQAARCLFSAIQDKLFDGTTVYPFQGEVYQRLGRAVYDWTRGTITNWVNCSICFAHSPTFILFLATQSSPVLPYEHEGVHLRLHDAHLLADKIKDKVAEHYAEDVVKFEAEIKKNREDQIAIERRKRLEEEEAELMEHKKDLSAYFKKPEGAKMMVSVAPKKPAVDDEFGNLDDIDFDAVAKKVDTMQSGGGEVAEPSNDCEGGGCTI